jgi:hypothetical protein
MHCNAAAPLRIGSWLLLGSRRLLGSRLVPTANLLSSMQVDRFAASAN